jgi:hypothetical protein
MEQKYVEGNLRYMVDDYLKCGGSKDKIIDDLINKCVERTMIIQKLITQLPESEKEAIVAKATENYKGVIVI